MANILIVDDEARHCQSLRLYLSESHRVTTSGSAERALEFASSNPIDLILLDIRLPGMNGLDAIELFRQHSPQVPIIVMTAFGTIETAVLAMQRGVVEYLVKPFPLEELNAVIRLALEARESWTSPTPEGPALGPGDMIIGTSPLMQRIFNKIALVANSTVPVLLTGESGTGKEVLARAIHRHSARRDQIFLPVVLAALSPNLIESELFGHTKGAFTGAEISRQGLLEQADGGTAFLDELGDINLPLQVKLLRAIEERQLSRVGEGELRPIDVRYIAATNKSLPELISRGEFREDLFYRLSVFHIELPPLRERREDIPHLAQFFLDRLPAEIRASGFTSAAMSELQSRYWYGNIRELRNTVEHASILSRGASIGEVHLPTSPQIPVPLDDAKTADQFQPLIQKWVDQELERLDPIVDSSQMHGNLLGEIEPILFEMILKRCHHNFAAASRILGVDPKTIKSRLSNVRR